MRKIVVDPNSFARRDPRLSVVTLDDLPTVGEKVLAVQPDDDGFGLVSPAIVRVVDHHFHLAYIEVDWTNSTLQKNED